MLLSSKEQKSRKSHIIDYNTMDLSQEGTVVELTYDETIGKSFFFKLLKKKRSHELSVSLQLYFWAFISHFTNSIYFIIKSYFFVELVGFGKYQKHLFFAAGLCFASDAVEISLLSFLSYTLQSDWGLNSFETSLLTSVVFLGGLIGTLILGKLADTQGR